MSTEKEPQANELYFDDQEFLERIRRLLANTLSDPLISKLSHSAREGDLTRSLTPRIAIVDSCVICDNRQVNLARSPKILELFRVFLEFGEFGLSRNELLNRIYAEAKMTNRSTRFQQCYEANLTKLVSRARIITTLALGGARDVGLNWFSFDPAIDGWHLYRITSSYIRSRNLSHSGPRHDHTTDTSTFE